MDSVDSKKHPNSVQPDGIRRIIAQEANQVLAEDRIVEEDRIIKERGDRSIGEQIFNPHRMGEGRMNKFLQMDRVTSFGQGGTK